MIARIRSLGETFKYIERKSRIFAAAALLITVGIAAFAGLKIHAMQTEILTLRGELNTKEAAMEYNRYLLTRVDIVTLVSNTVEDLLESNADNSAIENIVETLDPETTGLYGWFNGAYIDGAGWVPDEGYVPTERPWYIQTKNSDRKITFVEPYLDMQTKTIMMTVATLLSDGESVLAMDVSLAEIQNIIKQVSASTEGGQAFLLDTAGVVIAHSDESQLGRNYLAERDSLGAVVTRRLFDEGLMQFEVSTDEGNYAVYVDALEGGWYSVSLINADVWHRPIHRTMTIFSIILLLIVVSLIDIFLRMNAKNAELQALNTRVLREEKRGDELQALSETDRMTKLNDRISGARKVGELLKAGEKGMFLELDIDRFKAINDTYGHQTGDTVILAIANALRSTFRTNDVTMRLGGDEFGVFAVGIVDRQMGEAIIGRLFHMLEELDIPELNGEKVCVSVGAALCSGDRKMSFQELYAKADDALYVSKKTPGNSLSFSEK